MAKKVKRELVIVKKDGTTVVLPIVAATKLKVPKPMLHLDQMPKGGFRLIWSEGMIDEFAEIERFEVVREG
jgi:hypothetical protein